MLMKVDRYNYSAQFGECSGLIEELRAMLLGGRYILTDEVVDFERRFGAYVGVGHVHGVNSGTDALIIALLALGVGPGDEVITQANTFHATVAAIRLVGATPVLVDADSESFDFDHRQLRGVITERTKALLPVHLYGKTAPLAEILEVSEEYKLPVIEDAAQAHGARVNGKRAGSLGSLGCFSFHPSKNLAAAGDSGAVVTNDPALAEKVRVLRELGQQVQNHHVTVGLNSKLDAIQACILSWKLPKLDEWNGHRRQVAAWYRERLAQLPLDFQRLRGDEDHIYHLLQVRCKRRDELLAHLRSAGVDVVVRYPVPIHMQPAFTNCGWRKGQFPVAERLARELLCLPIRPDMTEGEVDYVAVQIYNFFHC